MSFGYSTGSATVETGSTAVTGSGTFWASNILPGDMLSLGGLQVPIASVESQTALTLAYAWPGEDATGAGYVIVFSAPERSETAYLAGRTRELVNATQIFANAAPSFTVQGYDIDAPPSSPALDDMYVVGGSPSGAWAGAAGLLAQWTGAAWTFTTPEAGYHVFDEAEAETWQFNGSAWEAFAASTIAAMATQVEAASGYASAAGTSATNAATSASNAATTLAGAVRHDTSQSLGDSAKSQARTNIGAVGTTGDQTIAGVKIFSSPVPVANASDGTHAVNRTTGDARYLRLAGGTMTGGLLIADSVSNEAVFALDGAGSCRWDLLAARSTSGLTNGSFNLYNRTSSRNQFSMTVEGAISCYSFSHSGNLQRWVRDGVEKGRVDNNGAFQNDSDERLKHDISPLGYGIDVVRSVPAVSFRWNGDETPYRSFGFIAQDFERAMPEAIRHWPKDDGVTYLGIDADARVAVLWRAVQQLAEANDALSARLAALESA